MCSAISRHAPPPSRGVHSMGAFPPLGSPDRPSARWRMRWREGLPYCAAGMKGLEFRRAAAETRALWVLANGYFQEQAPWTTFKSDPERAAVATRTALNLLTICAVVSWSIIPTLTSRVLGDIWRGAGLPVLARLWGGSTPRGKERPVDY